MTARREVRGWCVSYARVEGGPDMTTTALAETVPEWIGDAFRDRDGVVLIHADDHAALVAELGRLRILLDEAATDLEQVAEHRQSSPADERRPSEWRRYESDMDLPRRIRAALSPTEADDA